MTDDLQQPPKPYRILLYYKYVKIDNPEEFAAEHLKFCKSIGVLGRILISHLGINGTLSGTIEQTDQYINAMRSDPRFADMVYKIDESDTHAFNKIFVRHKAELVTFRLPYELDPNELTGKYLEPVDFYKAMTEEDVVIVDARTDYEYDLGHFRGAIRPPVSSFKEFPEWVRENLGEFKNKKVLTYCTGGIRCETFTGLLLKEGFQDVYQLHGGIVTYGKDETVKGRLFDGKCYVFDNRIAVPINHTEEDVIVSHCHHCGKPSDRYINCANMYCNLQHFCCEECEITHRQSCSEECKQSTHRRERDIHLVAHH